MNRSLKRRLKRVEEALGPDPSVDELYASIIWDFALTTDEKSLKLVKQAFATVLGRPAEEEEETAEEKEPPASPAVPPPVEAAPEAPPAPTPQAEPRKAEPSQPEAAVDPLCQPPPQWVEVRWRPRGEPDPYEWDGDDDYYTRPGTNGRAIVDYDPLADDDDND